MSESNETVSNPSIQAGARGEAGVAAHEPDREYDWTTPALHSGVVGAFVVAIIFLAVDLISGRPAMWTPAALGAALFLSEPIASSGDLEPMARLPVVFGYSLMHGAVFVSFGAMAASGRLTRERSGKFTNRVGAIMAASIFVGLELTFIALGWVAGPNLDLAGYLGSGWIAFANALAAIAMTLTIGRAARNLAVSSRRVG